MRVITLGKRGGKITGYAGGDHRKPIYAHPEDPAKARVSMERDKAAADRKRDALIATLDPETLKWLELEHTSVWENCYDGFRSNYGLTKEQARVAADWAVFQTNNWEVTCDGAGIAVTPAVRAWIERYCESTTQTTDDEIAEGARLQGTPIDSAEKSIPANPVRFTFTPGGDTVEKAVTGRTKTALDATARALAAQGSDAALHEAAADAHGKAHALKDLPYPLEHAAAENWHRARAAEIKRGKEPSLGAHFRRGGLSVTPVWDRFGHPWAEHLKATKTPATPPRPAFEATRQEIIDHTVQAARRPPNRLDPRYELLGTDGTWYGGDMPAHVSYAGERRQTGWVEVAPGGTRVGRIHKTKEDALAEQQSRAKAADDDLRQALEKEPDDRLLATARHFLKIDVAIKPSTSKQETAMTADASHYLSRRQHAFNVSANADKASAEADGMGGHFAAQQAHGQAIDAHKEAAWSASTSGNGEKAEDHESAIRRHIEAMNRHAQLGEEAKEAKRHLDRAVAAHETALEATNATKDLPSDVFDEPIQAHRTAAKAHEAAAYYARKVPGMEGEAAGHTERANEHLDAADQRSRQAAAKREELIEQAMKKTRAAEAASKIAAKTSAAGDVDHGQEQTATQAHEEAAAAHRATKAELARLHLTTAGDDRFHDNEAGLHDQYAKEHRARVAPRETTPYQPPQLLAQQTAAANDATAEADARPSIETHSRAAQLHRTAEQGHAALWNAYHDSSVAATGHHPDLVRYHNELTSAHRAKAEKHEGALRQLKDDAYLQARRTATSASENADRTTGTAAQVIGAQSEAARMHRFAAGAAREAGDSSAEQAHLKRSKDHDARAMQHAEAAGREAQEAAIPRPVIKVGPRGGKIIGYRHGDLKQPIYEGEAAHDHGYADAKGRAEKVAEAATNATRAAREGTPAHHALASHLHQQAALHHQGAATAALHNHDFNAAQSHMQDGARHADQARHHTESVEELQPAAPTQQPEAVVKPALQPRQEPVDRRQAALQAAGWKHTAEMAEKAARKSQGFVRDDHLARAREARAKETAAMEAAGIAAPQEPARQPETPTPPKVDTPPTPGRDPRLPAPGSTITRLYKGQAVAVKVLDDGGFEHQGKRYASLSRLASELTGNPTNGFAWFSLGKK